MSDELVAMHQTPTSASSGATDLNIVNFNGNYGAIGYNIDNTVIDMAWKNWNLFLDDIRASNNSAGDSNNTDHWNNGNYSTSI
jgi:hypothetical protein